MSVLINQELSRYIYLRDVESGCKMKMDGMRVIGGVSLDAFLCCGVKIDGMIAEKMASYTDVIGEKTMYVVPMEEINLILGDYGFDYITERDIERASFNHLCDMYARKQDAFWN